MRRYFFSTLFAVGVISSFAYGVIVGLYKFYPFDTLLGLKGKIDTLVGFDTLVVFKGKIDEPSPQQPTLDQQLMQYAFRGEAYYKVPIDGLIYPAISNVEDLHESNRSILTPRENYHHAYANISIGIAEQLHLNGIPILILPFTLNGIDYKAYAYGKVNEVCHRLISSAALIIPGSGNNQSLGIYENDPDNLHYGIIESLKSIDKVYVLIKPNRDARAWHNGLGMRINGNFVYNWQLRMGGSYSVSYLVEALALMKYLNECNQRTIVAGLSQGGAAALYVALQASPSQAIISSGYSILAEKVQWAGFNQLMGVPGSEVIATADGFVDSLRNSSTKYLFTWGKTEDFYYREDALNLYTASLRKDVPNAIGISHDGGHIFPVNEIMDFLNNHQTHSN